MAVDDHRGDATGVTWRLADVRDPTLASRLSGVDVVVHTDVDTSADSDPRERRARNVRAAQTVLTAAAAERVGRVVLVTSAMVYGARPDNPVPLPEDAPLLADSGGSLAGDLLEIEELARRSRRVNPGTAVTVVRPAALVGGAVDTLLTRHFEAPRLLVVRGCAPRWQFCHVDDLVAALELAAAGTVDRRLRGRLRRVALPGRGRVAERPEVGRAARPADLQRRAAAAPARRDARPVRPSCATWCTRGWWTARRCARPAGGRRSPTPRRCGPARGARRASRGGRAPAGAQGRGDHGGGGRRDGRRGHRNRRDRPPRTKEEQAVKPSMVPNDCG